MTNYKEAGVDIDVAKKPIWTICIILLFSNLSPMTPPKTENNKRAGAKPILTTPAKKALLVMSSVKSALDGIAIWTAKIRLTLVSHKILYPEYWNDAKKDFI